MIAVVTNTIDVAGTPYRLTHVGGSAVHVSGLESNRTVCGLLDPVDDDDADAPSCKRCLGIVTKPLASTQADDRIGLIASAALDALVEFGSARIVNVPGDQADRLRAALRVGLRRRRLTGNTAHFGDTVHVMSIEAYERIPEERRNEQIRLALERVGDPDYRPPAAPAHQVDWSAWKV